MQISKEKYNQYDLYDFVIDADPAQTSLKAKEEYKKVPPLYPDRFNRKVKMLWGIDIDDYPENSIISIGGYFSSFTIALHKETQILVGYVPKDIDVPYLIVEHDPEIYSTYREFIFMHTSKSETDLKFYIQDTENKYRKSYSIYSTYSDSFDNDEGKLAIDLLSLFYRNSPFYQNKELLNYLIEKRVALMSPNLELNQGFYRFTNGRLDHIFMYFHDNNMDSTLLSEQYLSFDPFTQSLYPSCFSSLHYPNSQGTELFRRPWHNLTANRNITSFLDFVLRLQTREMNKFVITYMSGKINHLLGGDWRMTNKDIKSNNYYGYTLLREFCENTMREMPTLEKIGTNFGGIVKEKDVLLYLEPFADSFDIDSIQPTETFKAYEMGHDDYYFVEIEKPVESPVAGPDGYAMILDRTELVYGYVLKNKVRPITDADLLTMSKYNDLEKSRTAIIDDSDGYTNIRAGQSAKTTIVGRIEQKTFFNYWATPSNWYIVQTKDGLRGFVYKDKIREKVDAGGWTILD